MSEAFPEAFLREIAAVVGASHLGEAGVGARLAIEPASTAEVAEVVRLCRHYTIAIVPRGGDTGLVGGTTSSPGEIVLSLRRMNRIERLDPRERVAVVESGVALEVLQAAAAAHGLEPGIDLAARGTATIGGMVSTNAGGIMAFRHGVMRHRVLGLEAVLPDGSIYSDLTRVVKNTAGYDLKHLFIGAEGTLGVVTRVAVQLEPLPQATATVLLGLPSVSAALEAINLALWSEVGHLRAAEGLWRSYIRLTADAHGWAGLALDAPMYLLLSLGGAHPEALQEEVERLFALVLERFPDTTGIIASSKRQEADLWRLREDTDQIYRLYPGAPSYDVSVPLSEMEGYVEAVLARLEALGVGLAPYVFGHLADGNLHIILNRSGALSFDLALEVEQVLYGGLHDIGGSFSAEHGVGLKRVHSLIATIDPTKLAAMQTIKRAFDTPPIMNPGKVLPIAMTPERSPTPAGQPL